MANPQFTKQPVDITAKEKEVIHINFRFQDINRIELQQSQNDVWVTVSRLALDYPGGAIHEQAGALFLNAEPHFSGAWRLIGTGVDGSTVESDRFEITVNPA